MTESNLRQRSFSDMSHSERAYCLAQHYEAMKCQGKRNDLLAEIEMLLNPHDTSENETLAEPQTRFRTDAKLGQDYGLSRDKVANTSVYQTLLNLSFSVLIVVRLPFLPPMTSLL